MVEAYKAKFIDFLLSKGGLRKIGDYELKSKRRSPWFLDAGSINDGEGLIEFGDAYASALIAKVGPENFDGLFGIPEKAKLFMGNVAAELARKGYNKTTTSYRKEAKTYGDATPSGEAEMEQRQKEWLLGAKIPRGSRQVGLDDVMTAGDAKEQAREIFYNLTMDAALIALMIAANRQEINEYGENAIADFTRRHNIPVHAVIDASDVFDHLKETERLSPEEERLMLSYFRAWGTRELRERYGLVSAPLIDGRTLIPACDLDDIGRYEGVVKATADVDKVGGYKVGFELVMRYGLPKLVEIAKKHAPNKKVIYDHQKAGTDIGDVQFGRKFAKAAKESGVDAIILFPQSGPVTQTAWTGEALQMGLEVIIGGQMTHKGYLARERGYIRDDAPEEIYRRAARHGICNFVVPGNNPEAVKYFKGVIESEGVTPVLFAPGFVTQLGKISDAGKAAGENFHPIVGRDIMNSADPRAAALNLAAEL